MRQQYTQLQFHTRGITMTLNTSYWPGIWNQHVTAPSVEAKGVVNDQRNECLMNLECTVINTYQQAGSNVTVVLLRMCLVVTVGQGVRYQKKGMCRREKASKKKKGKWRGNTVSPAQKWEKIYDKVKNKIHYKTTGIGTKGLACANVRVSW